MFAYPLRGFRYGSEGWVRDCGLDRVAVGTDADEAIGEMVVHELGAGALYDMVGMTVMADAVAWAAESWYPPALRGWPLN